MNNKASLRSMELKKDIEEVIPTVQKEKHLTSDVIYEILTRVSLDTLLRECRLVCKDWQRIISDTNFQLIHSQRTPIASGYFIQSRNVNGYNFSFVPCIIDPQYSPQIPSPSLHFLPQAEHIKIQGTSPYGSLLLCVSKGGSTPVPAYYICKPATCEWRKIPNPKTRFSRERIGIVVESSFPTPHYKILRLCRRNSNAYGYHCEMFDSNNWVWKRLEDIKLPKYVLLSFGCDHLVNGGLHWLTNDGRIFVFYIDQQNWTLIDLPHEIDCDFRGSKTMIHCDGKIGMLYATKEWMELWILENCCSNKPTWKKKYHNDLRLLHEHTGGFTTPLDMYSTDKMFMMNRREVVWYNCNSDTFTTSMFQRDSFENVVFPFRSEFNYL